MSDFADIKRRMDALAKPANETPPEWLDVWRDEIGFASPPDANIRQWTDEQLKQPQYNCDHDDDVEDLFYFCIHRDVGIYKP